MRRTRCLSNTHGWLAPTVLAARPYASHLILARLLPAPLPAPATCPCFLPPSLPACTLPPPPPLQVWSAADEVRPLFSDIDLMVNANLKRVQQAMRRHRIGPHHFSGSTGGWVGGWVQGCMHACMTV